MALEMIPSRIAALRNEYGLSVERINPSLLPWILPEIIRRHYDGSYHAELRILYEEGIEIRRQWIFRDSKGVGRLAASGTLVFFSGEEPKSKPPVKKNTDEEENGEGDSEEDSVEAEEPSRKGFIEIRDGEGAVVREFQFDEDSAEWDFHYFYRDGTLIRTETWFKEAPAPPVVEEEVTVNENEDEDEDEDWEDEDEAEKQAPVIVAPPRQEWKEPVFVRAFTDNYRYTRSGSLRAIDRRVHSGGAILRVGFPRLGPGASYGEDLVDQGGAYTASYFMDANPPDDTNINFNLDSRGRILGEVWKDESGKVIGELKNTWSGDRLQSAHWKSGNDERLIEYEYDRKGNPVVERNYRNGVLERSIAVENGVEIEEIYMNGKLVLRAHWENGVKVLEERVSGGGNSQRGSP
jgi:hypothetical protein